MTPQDPPIEYLSFFTGAGFLDIGFAQAGFMAVWHNECNPQFARGFEYGMAHSGISGREAVIQERRPIENLQAAAVVDAAFPDGPPQLWGVIGGPPCPDFSVAGKNRGALGDRGVLTEVFAALILRMSPDFFVIENVPGLLRTKKHREFLMRLIVDLEESYAVDYRLLNALDVGVPQDRQRVFIVGVEHRLADSLAGEALAKGSRGWFPWPVDARFCDAKTRFDWPSTNAFGQPSEPPIGTPAELMVSHHICDLAESADTPNAQDTFRVHSPRIALVDEGDDSRKSFKRLHRWRYSPTVAYGNNEVHLHPTLPRRLSVREAMRLQGVPDEYALPEDMPLSHKFKMVGNGVPVGLARAVASSMAEFLHRSPRATT